MDAAQILALWVHTVAFVIAWGYYGVLARIVVPSLRRSLIPNDQVVALQTVERRALPLVILSVVLFLASGTYLLVVDPHYAGLGNLFASTWTTLLLVKHVLVAVLIVLGVAVDYLIRTMGDPADARAHESDLRLVSLCADGATACGALIALLTVTAQAST